MTVKNYKIIFPIIFLIILLIYSYSIIQNKNEVINKITYSFDNQIYVTKIQPLINFLEQHPSIENFERWDTLPKEIWLEETKTFNTLFNDSWVKNMTIYKENNLKLIDLLYVEQTNPEVYQCVYLYWKDAFKSRGITWVPVWDKYFFKAYWTKMANNKLIKINNDFAKYCISAFF